MARRRGEVVKDRAACHPERVVYAKGLCYSCYDDAKARRRRETWPPERLAAWRAQMARRAWKHTLKGHGLTVEEYEAMAAAQGGVCAICRRPEPEGRMLHVDHDHATGRIRGLLCGPCNRALGMFGDDPATLAAAAMYLR